mmetsp:Transcript_4194/g.13374  ORF Transcript_4194/g.13374 Transcript_4194/m.13374 type:complete len:201 (-) Transcript_4194:1483-2085(-)
MGQKVLKAASQKCPGSLYRRLALSPSSAAMSSSPSAKSKSDRFSPSRSGFDVFGITTVPRCTPHRSSTCAGVRPTRFATAATASCVSSDSAGCAMPSSTYDDAPRLENAITWMPDSRAMRSSRCCVSCGCISTCSTAGFTRAYCSTCRICSVPMLQKPMCLASPASCAASIACHVCWYVTPSSSSMRGAAADGSWIHSGG